MQEEIVKAFLEALVSGIEASNKQVIQIKDEIILEQRRFINKQREKIEELEKELKNYK